MKSETYKILGLSKSEIKAYKLLLKSGDKLTAKEIAEKLNVRVEAAHRLLIKLKRKGLITSIGSHPSYFKTLPIEVGVTNVSQRLQSRLRKLIHNFSPVDSVLPLRIIPNRKTYHRLGEQYFKKAQKEVSVIASGKGQLSQDFTKTMHDATERKVEYRIISTTFGKPNQELLRNWRKNGFKVRYRKGKGFNLVIYDRNVVQLGFRLSDSSREKYGVVIKNESLAEFLGEFFDHLWKNSELLESTLE